MAQSHAQPSLKGSTRCVACGAEHLVFREHVSTEKIAQMWAQERCIRSYANQDAAVWLKAVTHALGDAGVRFDRCQACGLEMASPALCWPDGTYPVDEDYPARWEFDQALDDLGATPLRILELGCGTGVFLEMAAARGHTAVGLDFSEKAVAKAKEKGLAAIFGGFAQLEEHLVSTGSRPIFDAVVIFHVIEHLPDPGSLLGALAPFVASGTRLVVSCPGPDRFTRLIQEQHTGLRDFWDYPPHHVLRWTLPALEMFFERHGWNRRLAREEPVGWIGAAAQIGCTKAMWHGYIHSGIWRRLAIARGYATLAIHRSITHMTGLSIYAIAEKA